MSGMVINWFLGIEISHIECSHQKTAMKCEDLTYLGLSKQEHTRYTTLISWFREKEIKA